MRSTSNQRLRFSTDLDERPAMTEPQIRFDNGADYEQFMGVWSRLAGEVFLDWLAPAPAARWVDVGCGNGAFTELLAARCAPVHVDGIDPSEGQLAFARTRMPAATATFRQGDAMALPYGDASFDAAVMALVIFFVPDPVEGVAEMARVVAPGGSVSAYAWDNLGGGFPYAALREEMAAIGRPSLQPPSVEAANLDNLRALWTGAGLVDVETRRITVQRTYPDFDTYWRIARSGPPVVPAVAGADPEEMATVRRRLAERLVGADGRITCEATANAVKGRVPR
jgi:SAM-dependent methyltransferase